ncbi:MAG TPA: thioredoxin family protein [Planctomycetota bacterium]|nr:thioredoxin family protein [Planctomycetota bacterium]
MPGAPFAAIAAGEAWQLLGALLRRWTMKLLRCAVVVLAGAVVVAGLARAGEVPGLKELEARLAIRRAEALAEKKLTERAEALLKRVAAARPDLAGEVQKASEAIAARSKAEAPPAAAKDYQAALRESRRTGRPIMALFGREACGNCRYTKKALDDASLAPLRRQIVYVSLDCDAAENRPLMSRLRQGKDISILPFVFYLSPKEEVLDYTSGSQGADALRDKVKAALAKQRPTSDEQLAKAAKAVEKANTLMDSGQCGAAAPTYLAVAKMKSESALVEEARDSLEVITLLSKELLEAARAAAGEKDYAGAAARLAIVRRDFEGSKAAAEAEDELGKLRAEPEAKAALEAAGLATAAPGPKPPVDTPAPGADQEAAAKRLFSMAKNYLANKLPDRARPLLERIVKDHPDTATAAEARALLQTLQ